MNEQELKAAKETAETEKAAREKAEREAAELRARLAESETKSQALEREKRQARFKAEASELGAPAAFADVIDKVEALVGAELYGQLQTQLKAYAEQVKAGPLFKEKGSGGGAGAGSAAAQMEALAAQAVKDGRAKTKEQALAIVAREHPALATQHLQESRRH